MISKDRIFSTEIVSLKKLNEFSFRIPTYQRPYVWGDEQLKKLLDDFYNAFTTAPDQEYYIGTFLTRDQGLEAELIDGQQRFTTLWLISFVISRLCPESSISNFLLNNDELRLGFEIREEVKDFLVSLLEEDELSKKVYDQEFIDDNPYLQNIAKGLVFINGFINHKVPPEQTNEFGDFIFRQVHLIKNTTPDNTDLNKLFSTVNSAGVQLEQTDIVKANLLNLIDEKVKYGKIWEACENMNNFFERNVRLSFPSTDWNIVDFKKYYEFDGSIFRYESTNKNGINSDDTLLIIEDVNMNDISDYQHPTKNLLDEKDRQSEEIYCRSIINFGQLLIHTYRLHLYIEGKEDFEGTFHVNRLIEIFNSLEARKDPNEIKRFFQLLWKVRYLFDKYVIKWITDIDNKTESLELVNFNKNDKGYYSRTKYVKSNSSMLQSVLYFTGDYLRQYWLTTYLGYLLNNHTDLDATNEILLNKLEEFDNQFSLNDKLTDKDLSYLLLDKEATVDKTINIRTYLELNKGTAFKHYWFQKLEYILWKNWDSTMNTQEYNNYRITSRNSVEHIYPQNPENQIQHPQIEDDYLHSFGNLVLLSVAQNSEYSNKSFRVKKSMFRDRRETYDTLKSYYIFQKDNWNKIEIIKHLETMISKIEEHYDAK